MKPQNLHVHTTFCDGKNTAEEMVLGAMTAGCGSIGFSGHTYLPFDCSWTMAADAIPAYRGEILRLREKYRNQIEIFLGLEQDYWSAAPEGQWDYRIGSVHCLGPDRGHCSVDSSLEDVTNSIREYFGGDALAMAEDYYRLVAQVADRTGCEIVGHLDLVTKFNEGGRLFDEDSPRYRAAALEALDALLRKDVFFEINTGAMSRGYRSTPYPSPFLLETIRRRGGRILITGDSHSAASILTGYPQAVRLARDCGFTTCMYRTAKGFAEGPLPLV